MAQLTGPLANGLLNTAVSIGQSMGYEVVVEVSEHSIDVSLEQPDQTSRAWDPDLFSSGCLFVSGYANPIKPRVRANQELADPDTVDVVEGEGDETEDDVSASDGPHVQLISSKRYRDYMRQDLISQLLTPESRWQLMVYAMIGLGILQFVAIITTLYGTGTFA